MRTSGLLVQFVDDLRVRPVRTAITLLGITWGTVAVVVLLAFGVGMGTKMKSDARGLGDGIVILFGGRTTKSFQGFPEGRGIQLLEEDAQLLRREVAGIGTISPEYGNGHTRVRRGTNGTAPYVTGVEPVYGWMRNIVLEPGGRFLDRLDLEQRRRVVVLGDGIKKLLFDGEPAVGQTVQIGDAPFLVIGVMEHKTQNSSYSSRDEDRVFIPASTYRTVFGEHSVRNIVYRPANLASTGAVRRQVYHVLARRHVFDPADNDAIMIWDTNDMLRMFDNLFAGFTIFLGIVGSFTLAVGGIGVANIMYIVVRERTPEIGIKRSVGARRREPGQPLLWALGGQAGARRPQDHHLHGGRDAGFRVLAPHGVATRRPLPERARRGCQAPCHLPG
jgi:putative ABC transport system permease protein